MSVIMYMLVGNIGTGKSTTSSLLHDDETLYIAEDSIAPMMTDGRYDQGVWTNAHFRVYRKIKLAAVEAAFNNGFSIILDGTNIAVENRAKYLEIAKKHDATVICYVLTDHEYGLQNRIRNHRGTSAEVWTEVSASLQRKFEMPTKDEGIDKIIVIDSHPPVEISLT